MKNEDLVGTSLSGTRLQEGKKSMSAGYCTSLKYSSRGPNSYDEGPAWRRVVDSHGRPRRFDLIFHVFVHIHF